MRDHGETIGYVRVAFTEEDRAAIPPANPAFAQAAQNRMMHHEDPSTAIHDSLAPQPGDIVVRKTRVGALSDGTEDPGERARDVLLGQDLPEAGAGHRHRHAAHPAVAVDSRP
jgi:nicotinamidase-related amidase